MNSSLARSDARRTKLDTAKCFLDRNVGRPPSSRPNRRTPDRLGADQRLTARLQTLENSASAVCIIGTNWSRKTPLQLRSATVDLDGNLIAAGTMVHPIDDAGEFRPDELDRLKIDRETMRIIRCTAACDGTGFYHAEEIGTVLYVPESLASQIRWALRFGAKEPLEMAILQHQGSLASSASRIKHLTQPLSDWRLRVEEVDGSIAVVLSAALHSPHLREWLASEQNFWAGQAGARVEARFTITAATRVACFGAYVPDGHAEADGAKSQPFVPDGRRLNLENAPVGPMREFGIRNGHWVDIGSDLGGFPYIALTERRDVRRLGSGFLSYGHCVWPRIWIRGLSLSSVSSALGKEPLRLSGGAIAVRLSDDGREGWSQVASEAALEFRLQVEGLALDYFLTVAGRLVEGRVLLPWELLILRYPALAARRRDIIAAE